MRKLFAVTAACFLAVMLYQFVPSWQNWNSFSTTHYPLDQSEVIPDHEVRREVIAIREEAQQLTLKNEMTPAKYLSLEKRLYRVLTRHPQLAGPVPSGTYLMTGAPLMHLAGLFNGQGDKEFIGEAVQLRNADPELLAERARPLAYSVEYHPMAMAGFVARQYFFSLLFAPLFVLALMKANGYPATLAAAFPIRFLLVDWLAWPIGMWRYIATRYYAAYYTAKIIRNLSYVTTLVFSMFGASGNALAQSVKPDSKKSDSKNHTLQLDLRNSSFLASGPPDPNLFGRASFYEQRWFLESISSTNPKAGNWYNDVAGGPFLVRNTKFWALGEVRVSQNQNNARLLMVGTQLFHFSRRAAIIVPVLRYEYGLTGPPTKAFHFVTNPNVKVAKIGSRQFSIAPEAIFRKQVGKAVFWSLGAGARMQLRSNKPDTIEIGALTNSTGQWSIRSRLILNFTF